MWMSLAPFEIADIRMTLTSLMTGASSPCRASISALISSRSSITSTSPATSASMVGISVSDRVAMSSALSPLSWGAEVAAAPPREAWVWAGPPAP